MVRITRLVHKIWSLSLQLTENNSQLRRSPKIFLEAIFFSFEASAQTYSSSLDVISLS